MIFLHFNLCVLVKIKLHGTDKFLVTNGEDDQIHLTDHGNATEFNYYWNEERGYYDKLILHHDDTLAVDFDEASKKYVIKKEEVAKEIVPISIEIFDRTYWLTVNGQCMTYVVDTNTFDSRTCEQKNSNQLFVLDCWPDVTDLEIMDEGEEEEEIHVAPTTKEHELKVTHLLDNEEDATSSQVKIEKHGKKLIMNVYKFLYDMSSCMLQKNVCAANGWELFSSTRIASKSQKSYSASSSSKSSSGSMAASASSSGSSAAGTSSAGASASGASAAGSSASGASAAGSIGSTKSN